jgi:hypothetical protein
VAAEWREREGSGGPVAQVEEEMLVDERTPEFEVDAREQPALTGPDAKSVYAASGTSAIRGWPNAVSGAGGR